jgi:hypothetical protein
MPAIRNQSVRKSRIEARKALDYYRSTGDVLICNRLESFLVGLCKVARF